MASLDLGSILAEHLLPGPPETLGVAVSGGSDSVALLFMLHEFSQIHGTRLHVITVDHGLRAEAAEEADFVAHLCKDLDLSHCIARWTDRSSHGNLQNEARLARYRLISDWALAQDIQMVALGHTADDQAETVLMRLARGAGVEGLSGMAPQRMQNGVTWVRPFLNVRRRDLQENLRRRNVTWCEDPSNEDNRFDRVKIRRALEVLEPLGINTTALGQVASNMSSAREALSWQTAAAAKSAATVESGAVRLDWQSYEKLPDEIARRILLGALGWISGAAYAPRRKAVLGAIFSLKQGVNATVDGCQVARTRNAVWVFREYKPVEAHTCGLNGLWDRRWRMHTRSKGTATHIGALGAEGLLQVPDWRKVGLPRDVLLSMPAVWNGADLVAAPHAGHENGWCARLEVGKEAFFSGLLSH
ncbi:tRNA lysidine(34) synthetase TilS [Roseobacter sp.]|uniref:tRNA lysidine(34) synthetase TilS n=1 Tax=Roseobacter sp. TaxID=1907202 RepID=UPI00385E131D